MLGQRICELGPGTRVDVAPQQCVQHGHEVALAGPERPVQAAGLGPAFRKSGADQPERFVERDPQLRGHNVGVERRLGVLDTLG